MMQARRLTAIALSGLAVVGPFSPAIARSPYPQGMDYRISHTLLEIRPACINAPIDAWGAPDQPVRVRDLGAENTPERRAAIDALEQLSDLGVLARLPPREAPYRDYRIVDRQAHEIRGVFCYGQEVLTKIVSISPPRSDGRFCLREAQVLTQVRDVPDWLARPSFAPYVENRSASKGNKGPKTVALYLIDGRWEAQRFDEDLPADGPPSNPCRGQR